MPSIHSIGPARTVPRPQIAAGGEPGKSARPRRRERAGQILREKDGHIKKYVLPIRNEKPCPGGLVNTRLLPGARFLEERRSQQGSARRDLSARVLSSLFQPPCHSFHQQRGYE